MDDIKELKQELEILQEKNTEMYCTLCDCLTQIEEANKVIKLYAESTIGEPQEDGTYKVLAFNRLDQNVSIRSYNAVHYDPRPAKQYLEKWVISKK